MRARLSLACSLPLPLSLYISAISRFPSFLFNRILNKKIFWIRKQTCTFIGSWAFNFEFQVVNEFSIMKFQLVWHTHAHTHLVHCAYIQKCIDDVIQWKTIKFSACSLCMDSLAPYAVLFHFIHHNIHFVNLN